MDNLFKVFQKEGNLRRVGCNGKRHMAQQVNEFPNGKRETVDGMEIVMTLATYDQGPCDGSCRGKKTAECFIA